MGGSELIGKEEKEAIGEVIDRGGVLLRYGFDEKRKNVFKVREFEEAFAKYVGAKHALAVNSGTASLRVALGAMGIGRGDEVITQSFTFVATVEAILESGATPVITEVDKTLNMDPEDLKKRITPRTRAIMPVHMLGVPAKLAEIMEIGKEKGIPVLEDSCQACGTGYKGKKTGTLGLMGCFSFDYVKTITTGEGGMVVTDDDELYLKATYVHDHGHEHRSDVPRGEDSKSLIGFNFRMNEIQGAIGLVQLKRLDYVLKRQRENKARIKKSISGIKGMEFRELPDAEGDGGDTLIFFLSDAGQAAKFEKGLTAAGVGTKILPSALGWHFIENWPHMLKLPVFPESGQELSWPQSKALLYRGIAISIGVEMDGQAIDKTISGLQAAAKQAL